MVFMGAIIKNLRIATKNLRIDTKFPLPAIFYAFVSFNIARPVKTGNKFSANAGNDYAHQKRFWAALAGSVRRRITCKYPSLIFKDPRINTGVF